MAGRKEVISAASPPAKRLRTRGARVTATAAAAHAPRLGLRDTLIYPLDADRVLVKESIDDEGYTHKVFKVFSHGEMEDMEVVMKIPKIRGIKPPKANNRALYPLDAHRELVDEKEENGMTVKTFHVATAEGQTCEFKVRSAVSKAARRS